ncbi:MAG: hypothetical protein OXG27_15975 [Chloroflexi bacterium]|nr:hypothetical protein [Chloroflexota bacterium]
MPKGKTKRRRVELVDPEYRPTKRELEQDLRVTQDFSVVVQTLVQPVEVKRVRKPKS